MKMASEREKTTVRLRGYFQAEHRGIEHPTSDNGPQFVLDLMEVTIVDVEVVRFLGACEANGLKIVHCPQYIREWMKWERQP
jgi:hypothetical protein